MENCFAPIKMGIIYQCLKGRDYGIILSIYGDFLYYFEKDLGESYLMYDLVTYMVDDNNPEKACHVFAIKKYEKCTDLVGKMGTSGQKMPLLEKPLLDECPLSVAFIVEKDGKEMCYRTIFGGVEKYAYSLYKEKISSLQFADLTVEELSDKIIELKTYVNSFDANTVIDTYTVTQDGWLQRRVGRDDFFFTEVTKTVQSEDSYIKSLLPLGESKEYETYGGETSYHYIDDKLTRKGKKEAWAQYSKEKHLAYLLKNYYDEFQERVNEHKKKLLVYEWLFNVYKVKNLLKWLTFETNNYQDIVYKYNHHITICVD